MASRGHSLYVFMPMSGDHLSLRYAQIDLTMNCLASALSFARPDLDRVRVHLHVNGHVAMEEIGGLAGRLRMRSFPFILTTDPVQDKVRAVNHALAESRRWLADSFVNVDNDLYFRPHLLRLMLSLLHGQSGTLPVGCEKLPLIPRRPTRFQREFSIFSEFAVRAGIFDTRRATSALYMLSPARLDRFPAGCNEGDYLTQTGIMYCNDYVYSAYPADVQLELTRRRRLFAAAERTGFRREFQDPSVVVSWFESPRVARLITEFQMWPYLATFSMIMLHDQFGIAEAHANVVQRHRVLSSAVQRSVGIDLIRWPTAIGRGPLGASFHR